MSACSSDESKPDQGREVVAAKRQAVSVPAEAICDAVVTGVGTVDTETDYVPHVVQCENGGAPLEALKAQAVAARSYLYYSMISKGSICDGQSCQVYSCGKTPTALHLQAAKETSGQILSWGGIVTVGFYVNGDPNSAAPSCKGAPSATNEHWVTYNEGKSGTDVTQTELGWVFNPGETGYGQNRGCMSQNGAHCLDEQKGYDYKKILQFYYGADIEILAPAGPCVTGAGGSAGAGGSSGSGGSAGGAGPTDASTDKNGSGGTAGSNAGGSTSDGAVAEAASPVDGGGKDGGGAYFAYRSQDDSGCGCTTAGSTSAPWGFGAAGLLLALSRVRRRRQSPADLS